MPTNIQRLEAEVLGLSPEERADLADKLWLSVESQERVAEAWTKEIQRRIGELQSGAVTPELHEDVIADLRARYGE